MRIVVKCIGSSHVTLPDHFDVGVDCTVRQLKTRIAEVIGVPDSNLKLLSMGKALTDNCTLCSYKVTDGSKLHLMVKTLMLPEFSDELHAYLRPHFSETQCQKIIKNVFVDLQKSVKSMSLYDIEALADQILQEQS